MRSSVIIPTPPDVDSVISTLEAVTEATDDAVTPFEVVLVNMEPPSAELEDLYQRLQGDFQIVRAGRTLSQSDAFNVGAEVARGEVLVFLEPVARPQTFWLEHLLAPLEDGADIGGAWLVDMHDRIIRGGYGIRRAPAMDIFPAPFYPGAPITLPAVAGRRRYQACAGGALAIKRAVHFGIAGFDPGLDGEFLWLDLGLRATRAGATLVCCSEARVRSAVPEQLNPKGTFYFSERFKERWAEAATLDFFERYREDGYRIGAVRGHQGEPAQLVLWAEADGTTLEVPYLRGPWPRQLLRQDGDRTLLHDVGGGPPWEVNEASIDRAGEVGSYYEVSSLPDLEGGPKIQAQFVGSGKRVLELGCASGYFTRHLVAAGCRVVGVEIDAQAARHAQKYAERVHVADLEAVDLGTLASPGEFDVVLAGDVLEHLRDPEALLRNLRPYLAPGAAVVGSVPNVTHAGVRLSLLLGQWRYRKLGLLDRTHLRFFTRWSLSEMLRNAGFRVTDLATADAGLEGVEFGVPVEALPPGVVEFVLGEPDARVYQFIFKAVLESASIGRD